MTSALMSTDYEFVLFRKHRKNVKRPHGKAFKIHMSRDQQTRYVFMPMDFGFKDYRKGKENESSAKDESHQTFIL